MLFSRWIAQGSLLRRMLGKAKRVLLRRGRFAWERLAGSGASASVAPSRPHDFPSADWAAVASGIGGAEANDPHARGFCSLLNAPGVLPPRTQGPLLALEVTRVFDPHLTGIGHYSTQLARGLMAQGTHQCVLYSARPLPAWMLDRTEAPLFRNCPAMLAYQNLLEPAGAPELEQILGPTSVYLHTSAMYTPFVRHPRMVAVIYDLAPLDCPESVPAKVVDQCRAYNQFLAGHARHFIAISDFSRQSWCAAFGVAPDRVSVVPVGLDPLFRRQHSPAEQAASLQRLGLGDQPYLLCVGTRQPRKNLLRLLEAYGHLRRGNRRIPRLVLAGSDRWADVADFAARIERLNLQHDVISLGYVDRMDMPALYARAHAFIYPSYYEGYGMPVAEALACGTPVICGRLTSLPEVAGDAAHYCDPMDVASIERALKDVCRSAELRDDLRARARQRAAVLPTWADVARQVDHVLTRVGEEAS